MGYHGTMAFFIFFFLLLQGIIHLAGTCADVIVLSQAGIPIFLVALRSELVEELG